jgi:hypothetical protein
MEKERLEKLINQELSQREIAEKLEVSQSTVKYWLKKYKLHTIKTASSLQKDAFCSCCGNQLKGRQKMYCSGNCKTKSFHKLNPDKNYFSWKNVSELGQTLKRKEVEVRKGCGICGYNENVSALSFHHREPSLKSFPLTIRNFGRKSKEQIKLELKKCDLLCINCHMEIESPNLAKETAKVSHFSTTTGLKRKKILVEEAGGKCRVCSYEKNYRALHFHHIDPSTRSFGLNIYECQCKPLEELRSEAAKCVLLCANCHSVEHYPHLEIGSISS